MNKRTIWSFGLVLLSGAISFLYVNMSRPLLATHVDIYISPTGSDTNDGLSPNTALKTLARAHTLVASRFKTQPSDIEIIIAPGVYFNQTVGGKPCIQIFMSS